MKTQLLSRCNVEGVSCFTDSNHWGYVNIWSLRTTDLYPKSIIDTSY